MTSAAASSPRAAMAREPLRPAFNWRLACALIANFGAWWLIGAAVLRLIRE